MTPAKFPRLSRGAALSILKILLLAALLLQLLYPYPARGGEEAEILKLLGGLNVVEEDGRRMVEIKLKDAVRMAMEGSNTIKASKIGEKIAESALLSLAARNNPTLTNSVDYTRSISPLSSSSSGDNFLNISRSDSVTISSEYSKTLSSGMEYSLKYSEVDSSSALLGIETAGGAPAEISGSSGELSISSLTGSLNIPVFQDFGSELGDIPVRQGEIALQQSRLSTRKETYRVLKNIAVTYWRLVEILENISAQQEAVSLSERLLNDNRERLKVGVISPADVKISEAQLARDRQNLLEFKSQALLVEDQARAVLNLEKLEMGLKPVDSPRVRETRFDFQKLKNRVFENNADLALLIELLKSKDFDLLEAKNKEKTDLDLSLYYVFNGYDTNTMGGISGFSEAKLGGYGANLTWTVPLFDQVTQQTIMQKNLERSQLELRKREVESGLTVNLQSVLRQLRLVKAEVETAQVSVSLANELLRNEIKRFRLGKSTSFRVAQFQQDLVEAGRREIVARIRFERSFLDMLILTGDIFSFYDLPSPF